MACIDEEGVIYILREYYQKGLSPLEHKPNLMQLQGFMNATMYSDPSIFHQSHAQNDGTYKALASLYAELDIDNLVPAPENSELLGMERILEHWTNLDQREPTLKIVCPARIQDIARPRFGIHNYGCPNLLWELRRTRRAENSAAQLAIRNPTEKIIDKDNHLRDCLKYLLLTLPEPAAKTWKQIAAEEIRPLAEAHDYTSAYVRYLQMKAMNEVSNHPVRRRYW